MKGRTKIFSGAVVCAILGLGSGAVAQESPDPLDGTRWDLFAYRKTKPIEGTELTVRFTDGRVWGETGCNRYSGSYVLRGDSITVRAIAVGDSICDRPGGVMEQEEYYVRFLSDVGQVILSDGRLRLRRPDGEELTYLPRACKK